MRRLHLIEIHEESWFPDSIRKIYQRSFCHGMVLARAFDNVVEPLKRLIGRVRTDAILDLCTGSGELAVSLWQNTIAKLETEQKPKLMLSDLYPNVESYAELKERHPEAIDFYAGPVNALEPPADAPRVWMFMDSFHHFRPDDARNILRNAAENADGIGIFEASDRSWGQLLRVSIFAFPFSLITTAFLLRPIRLQNLLWGLFIPVIPLAMWWDSLVSNIRTHTVEEIEAMTRSIGRDDFCWEVGKVVAPNSGGLKVTYVLGWRKQSEPGDEPA